MQIIKLDNIDLIYLFHLYPIGFVLVPTDDRVTPILAYSFESDFISENIPGNLSYIINQYKSKILDHSWAVKGGKVPKIGRQLTIERPELVKRVKPPIIMIAKTINVRIISQTNILILKLLFLFLEFIKGI